MLANSRVESSSSSKSSTKCLLLTIISQVSTENQLLPVIYGSANQSTYCRGVQVDQDQGPGYEYDCGYAVQLGPC